MSSGAAEWNAVLTTAGITSPGAASEPALARVSAAVGTLASERFSDGKLLLSLRLAATSGDVHDRLTEVDAWYRERREAARIASGAVAPAVSYPPRSIAVAVLTFLFAAVGPVLAYPSVRTSSDYFFDLEPAAVASGALALVSAIWFLIAEVVRIPFAGTRTRLYGPAVFFVPIGLVTIALATTVFRANTDGGMSGAVVIGISLQIAAIVVYVIAAICAVRNRADITSATETPAASLAQDDLEHALRSRMDVALARATRSDYDRAAAVDGVRQLVETGKLSTRRAESAVRSLMGQLD